MKLKWHFYLYKLDGKTWIMLAEKQFWPSYGGGKNAHTPHKLLTTGQKTPLTFLLANLLLKLFTIAKSIL